MGVFGDAVAAGVDLEAPLQPVEGEGVRVEDGVGEERVVREGVTETLVLGNQFVSE